MSYIVYHITSTQMLKSYRDEASAKRGRTCMNRNAGAVKYAYASGEDYRNNVVGMKTVTNLLTGKDMQIPTNTPSSCDPSSELYWSM
jgi:hypothetical protein